MTDRSIRRAAERQAQKDALKAQRAQFRAAINNEILPAPGLSRGEALLQETRRALHASYLAIATKPLPEAHENPQPEIAPRNMISAASEARIVANRANAKFSTGPRTDIGKGISSQNRLTHGLAMATDNFRVLRHE